MRFKYQKVLSFWRKVLKLRDWAVTYKTRIELPSDRKDEIIYATVDFEMQESKANINFSNEFSHKLDYVEKEKTVIHELLHIRERAYWKIIEEILEKYKVDDITQTLLGDEREIFINGLSDVLYDLRKSKLAGDKHI
jgi:hypothetical protein